MPLRLDSHHFASIRALIPMFFERLRSNRNGPSFSALAAQVSTATIPPELWIHISQHFTDNELWSLRVVCSALYRAALDRKFKTLDLSFASDPALDGHWNSWKVRLGHLDKLLMFVEQPYIASRVCSVQITPDIEYAFISGFYGVFPPTTVQRTRRALRLIWRTSEHPLYDPPSYREEARRARDTTLRLHRLVARVLTLDKISSITIVSGRTPVFGGRSNSTTTKRKKLLPLVSCVYTTSLLKNLSSHLVYLQLDLSEAGVTMKGFDPCNLDFHFPQLETVVVCIKHSSLRYLPHIQRFLAHSHRLKEATIGLWLESNEPWNRALLPIQHHRQPISSIRSLDIQGTGLLSSQELNIPMLFILPQLEQLFISDQPSPSTSVITQLNTQALRILKLGQLQSESSFQSFCNTFASGDSLLEELTILMGLVSGGPMGTFPIFPRLKSVMIVAADWNSSFLTLVPTCAPTLKSLSLHATTGIIISTGVVLPVWDIYGDPPAISLIKEDIEQLECLHWAEWGLKSVEMVGTNILIRGKYEDAKLWTPIKAFVRKLPSLTHWMDGVLQSTEVKGWP
ncbi:hypothetical protein DL96DRAFT_1821417 [Flagelloscypha sp. PMI_526]|nr:hypothetical protein DL96DRAFT_1821417 [Flagelloscypha sp. PMI_526]